MITDEIRGRLFELQDAPYRDFQSRLIPAISADSMIGVRTPELRKLAKEIAKRADVNDFLSVLPHKYFEENQLHAFIISGIRDYEVCMAELRRFLPYVDNWATCDQMSPKVFKKHRAELEAKTSEWLASGETYTVRFGIKMLMEHFLDEDFKPEYLKAVSEIRSDEYYISMMQAWYFATALAKQYDAAIPYIEAKCLDEKTHNRAIQKAVESCCVTPEAKAYLKKYKVRS